MTTSEEIIAAAEALPEETRLHIVDSLLQSIHRPNPSVDEAWAQVIERRVREIESGEATLVPAEEVYREAHRRLSNK
jgi:putative addiction module component (TIGR02574 family)